MNFNFIFIKNLMLFENGIFFGKSTFMNYQSVLTDFQYFYYRITNNWEYFIAKQKITPDSYLQTYNYIY